MTELKTSVESFKSRLNHAEEKNLRTQIGHLKLAFWRNKEQKGRRMKKAYRPVVPCKENIDMYYEIPKGGEREKGTESLFE